MIFGDLDAVRGEKLAKELNCGNVHFLKVNVTSYEDNLALFRLALKTYGKVDHAMAIAGIVEQGNWFDPELTVEEVEKVSSFEDSHVC